MYNKFFLSLLNKKIFFVILIAGIFTISCQKNENSLTDPVAGMGKIPINISLSPIQNLDVIVTSALAKVSRNDQEFEQALTIENNTAYGFIDDLPAGIWHLEVELFADNYLVASGETDVEVLPGQSSVVNLTLVVEDLTGSIEIVVDWDIETIQPERVLFIGNSYTYSNDGLEQMFRQVALATENQYTVEVQAVTGGGYTLQNHYDNPTTRDLILNGNWDIVVLQEQSQMPIYDLDYFLTYATKLDSLIDNSGAQTCFFMTWAREYDQTQIDGLSSAYLQAGDNLDAIVVPVGLIFNYVYEDDPIVNLYSSDGSHPSVHGTYLSALSFFQSLFAEDALTTSHVSFGMTSQEAIYLREKVSQWYSINDDNY